MDFISRLRIDSPYYPEYLIVEQEEEIGTYYYASTLLRKQDEGKWYDLHFVDAIYSPYKGKDSKDRELCIRAAINSLIHSVYKGSLFYTIKDSLDHVILSKIQITEEERLIRHFFKPNNNEPTIKQIRDLPQP